LVEVKTALLYLETSGTARPNTRRHIPENGILKLIFDREFLVYYGTPGFISLFAVSATRVSSDRLQYHSAVYIYVLDVDCTSYKNSVSSILCFMLVRGTFYWTWLQRLGSVERTDFPGKARSLLPLKKSPTPWSWYIFIDFISQRFPEI